MEQTLGKRIVANRKRLGMTQDQLAERLGITAQAVSKWENDQSCPDITMLPKLAEVFGISTDELLGLEKKEVHQAELVEREEDAQAKENIHASKGDWEFKLDNSRKGHIGIAVWVLLVGGLLLAANILKWNVSVWGIIWPSGLLVFGLFGVLPRPSIFRLGCLVFGAYFLLDIFVEFPFGREIVLPAFLVLFGLSLLIDALHKPKNAVFQINHNGKNVHRNYCNIEGERFECATAFGENYREIRLPRLSAGKADLSFGELTVDMTGCEEIADGCRLELNCSFGELELVVPKSCRVEPASSTAFASVDVRGNPADDAAVTVYAECSVSFGEIQIKYV